MTKAELLEQIKQVISRYGDSLSDAYIFGSFAAGNDDEYSDVDIALDCEDCFVFFDICGELDRILTMRRFDVHNTHYENFRFDTEAITSGIKLL